MKLPELKEKLKSKYIVRVVAGVLTIALVGTGIGATAVFAEKNDTAVTSEASSESTSTDDIADDLMNSVSLKDEDADKDESVYLISDANGNVDKTIVVDHLKNKDKKDTLEDASNLSDIENVKGKETFEQNGDKLTWQAGGNDIYYQGTASEEPPVTQKVTYYLDGKEISPEDLAGKSGKVKIRFDYTNTTSYTEEVNGEKQTVSVPFAAVTGLVLGDGFSNVEVTNGKVEANDTSNIVIGYALPGLKDSLGIKDEDLDDDVNIPEYMEVSADVENFSLSTAMTFVVNASDYVSSDGINTSSLDDMINDLTDATTQLKDGSAELADGTDTLKDGLGTLQSGLKSYTDGANSLASGASQLDAGIGTLANGAGTLASGVATLNDGANKIATSANSINAGVKQLNDGLTTPLTTEEKAEYQSLAKDEVDKQLADDKNETSYNNTKAYAADTYYKKMTSDASVQQTYTALKQNSELVNMINEAAKTQVDATLQEKLKAAIPAETIGDVKANYNLSSDEEAIKAIYNSDARVQEVVKNTLRLEQTVADYDTLVSAVASQQSDAKIYEMASQIMTNVAAASKDEVGESVATAAKTGAETGAQSAVITGIESTKAKISTEITTVQKDSGYSLVTGADALSKGASDLAAGTQQLANKVPDLTVGIKTLKDGSSKLNAGAKELTSNNDTLNSGASQLADGSKTLADGAHTLADGIVQFNEEGINKILDAYNGDLKPLTNKLQAVIDAGEDYQTYSAIADGQTGSVKFIYKLASIESDSDK